MVSLQQLSPRLVKEFKTVRLRALKDTPTAFGSTYAKEFELSEDGWLERAASWNRGTTTCYIAFDKDAPCGIIAGYFDKNNAKQAWVASMWVAPSHRRTGLGTMLMNGVQRWAHSLGAGELRLRVTSSNEAAIGFYQRCGFAFTGVTGPYDNDPALFEHEMAKPLIS